MKKLNQSTSKQDFFKNSKSDSGSSSSHHREWVKGTFWGCFLFQQKGEWLWAEDCHLCLRVGDKLKAKVGDPESRVSGTQCSPNLSHRGPRLSPKKPHPLQPSTLATHLGPHGLDITSDPHLPSLVVNTWMGNSVLGFQFPSSSFPLRTPQSDFHLYLDS